MDVLLDEEDAAIAQSSNADARKKGAFEKYKKANAEIPKPANVQDLRQHHMQMCAIAKEKKTALRKIDSKRKAALADLVQAINDHLENRRGPFERVLEEVMPNTTHFTVDRSTEMIACGYWRTTSALRNTASGKEAQSTEERINVISNRHEKIFKAFGD